jgi:hypothetical protein
MVSIIYFIIVFMKVRSIMKQLRVFIVTGLALGLLLAVGCGDEASSGSTNHSDIKPSITDNVDVNEDSGEVYTSVDSSKHRGDTDLFLINCGMTLNDGADVIRGEDGEHCIVDEQSGTCYKMTLAGTRWKLINVMIKKYKSKEEYESTEEIDCSGKNIIYEFKGNDKLVVSGRIGGSFVYEDFTEGEHS